MTTDKTQKLLIILLAISNILWASKELIQSQKADQKNAHQQQIMEDAVSAAIQQTLEQVKAHPEKYTQCPTK